MRNITVLVYERLKLLRGYICASLKSSEALTILQDTGEVTELVSLMGLLVPDVLVLSLDHDFAEMSSIAAMQGASPRTDIIVLAPNIPNKAISDMIHEQALNYVNKASVTPDEVIAVIVTVGHRHSHIDKTFEREIITFYKEGTPALTKRELRVLEQLTKGCTNLEIAENLGITVETVKTHASRIYFKLNVSGRLEAGVYALKNKLIAQLGQQPPPRRR